MELTPLYDVLTAQPSLDARRIEKKHLKLAMSVGDNRHSVLDRIKGRHFLQTAKRAGLPESLAREALHEVSEQTETALESMEALLPSDFPEALHASVCRGLRLASDHRSGGASPPAASENRPKTGTISAGARKKRGR